MVALDSEGVGLARTGKICLIQVATPKKVYLFDVLKGGKRLFVENGLKTLLESPKVIKIVHDCRRDNEALFYQFAIKMKGVWDSQVAYAVMSQLKGFKTPYPISLNTLLRVCGVEGNKFKDNVKSAMAVMKNFWGVRPLSRMMIDYAAGDVRSLFDVYNAVNKELSVHAKDRDFKRLIEDHSVIYLDVNFGDKQEASTAANNLYGIKLWDDDIGYGARCDSVFPEYDKYVTSKEIAMAPSIPLTCRQEEEKVVKRRKSRRALKRMPSKVRLQNATSPPAPVTYMVAIV